MYLVTGITGKVGGAVTTSAREVFAAAQEAA